ncbi:hypothetical protein ACLOJK_024762 [Asimina triloba]
MSPEKKVVVEEVSGWLRVYDDGSVDRTWTGPPEVKFLVTPVPQSGEFINGVATRDFAINTSTTGLPVRIYKPEMEVGQETKLPIFLHFHGGGFCMSRANWYMYHQFYTKLVSSVQAVCVSVEFRLAPEHRLPAAIDDCHTALIWLSSVARSELSESWFTDVADFGKVFLIGDSTGGNIVHQVASRAASSTGEMSPLRVAGGVLIHPGFVRAERSKSELVVKPDPFLTLDMVDKFLAMALPEGSTKDHPVTCPMGPAAPSLAELKLPPFLVAVAQNDPDTAIQTELLIQTISNFTKRH